MELRKLKGVIGLAAAGILLVAGCGGTLEGKYRRGQITTSTTGGSRSPATTPGTGAPTTTTTTAPPTGGNAAGQTAQGESKRRHPGSTLVGSAVRRSAVLPLGGRHR